MGFDLDMILGLLFSLCGIVLIILAAKNRPVNNQSESSKSANIQLAILGIGLLIGGLLYAF
jgi:predicted acyltransferase